MKVVALAIAILILVTNNVFAMKQDFKAQITNNKKVTYAITIPTNHGPAHETIKATQTINKAHSKEIILRGEGAQYKVQFKDNGTTELLLVKGNNATPMAKVEGHAVRVVLDSDGVKLIAQEAHPAAAAQAQHSNPSHGNSNNAQPNVSAHVSGVKQLEPQDIKFSGPEVMQGTKVQITSQVKTPYIVTSRSPIARYNDPINRGQTIHKENISDLGFTGDGAQHKLVFNNNGSTDLLSLKGDVSTKVGSVDSHNVVVVISPTGLRLQKQAILVKEFIPGTGVGVWVGSIVHGDINM